MRCLECNRILKDPESIKRGRGPHCWAKLLESIKPKQKIKAAETDIKGQINMFGEIK